ncbi:hypothetical protein A167_00687 [Alcanivorax sp. S71-1-4]|uniref:hypothetical protein n=1 Tax=Alcanivorax sp. S71-1-4 TaxID=1177159 RepID=UPI00135B8B5F|nr:hypothetical protein [Alcanivorax sp. S71-1-4]KAF0810407.1 hypothetical protein A167_00687 [Alcanivorax sp. S71-1-4]
MPDTYQQPLSSFGVTTKDLIRIQAATEHLYEKADAFRDQRTSDPDDLQRLSELADSLAADARHTARTIQEIILTHFIQAQTLDE